MTRKTYKMYDNTIIKKGKLYKWSGITESLYTTFKWYNNLCRIKNISDTALIVYDIWEMKEYEWEFSALQKCQIKFKRLLNFN